MKFLILVGCPAVGKMTVGRELTKITDFKLFHGHMILEPVLEIFGERNARAELQIRDIIFEDFAKSDKYGLIFTYVMAFDLQSEWDYIDHMFNIFRKQNGEVYFVELVAPQEIRLKRNMTESRLLAKPSKRDIEMSEKRLLGWEKEARCVSNDGEVMYENYMKIDNSELSPDVVAKVIKDRFSL